MYRVRIALGLALCQVFLCAQVCADVSLPKVINSHMVLQQEKPLPIWGSADPNEHVAVSMDDGSPITCQADEQGNWKVVLPAVKADGKAHRLVIAGKNTIELTDILIGEVWLGSGQSNIEMGLVESANGAQEAAAANFPDIRLYHGLFRNWCPCTPENVSRGRGTGFGKNGAGGFSAVMYFFAREIRKSIKVPIGLINVTDGGTLIHQWMAPDGNLYRQRIQPLVPLAIRGVLWYQGQADCANHISKGYCGRMKTFVEGWRKTWGQGAFPFYYVQIAPFNYMKYNRVRTPFELPRVWAEQAAALSIPNTGMAVITDIADLDHIHPENKLDVGKRLALWALARTYGQKNLVCAGPIFKSMSVEGQRVRVTFEHVGSGLQSREGKPLSWFTIAGEDMKFVDAKACIEGDNVVVSSTEVSKPVAVRFGWHELAQPNLMNREGLPASPFATDYVVDCP